MNRDVIIALDMKTMDEVKSFLSKMGDERLFLKVGMELYYACGVEIITYVKSLGHKLFLDLKLFDIPNTVKSALEVLKDLNVDIINIHTLGGCEMMTAASSVFKGTDTLLIGVTILTSTNEDTLNLDMNIKTDVDSQVVHLTSMAIDSGLNGIVCSACDVANIKNNIDQEIYFITPGIRRSCDSNDDQKRVMTPYEARVAGSTHIVVGRPINKASNPLEVYNEIKKEFIGE